MNNLKLGQVPKLLLKKIGELRRKKVEWHALSFRSQCGNGTTTKK
jgi:hypothetical protein